MQAIIDFLNTNDWQAKQQIVEAQQTLLFQPEVEALFEAQIEEARSHEDQHILQLLELHLSLLQACKRVGIAQAFADLEQQMGNEQQEEL